MMRETTHCAAIFSFAIFRSLLTTNTCDVLLVLSRTLRRIDGPSCKAPQNQELLQKGLHQKPLLLSLLQEPQWGAGSQFQGSSQSPTTPRQ